jgi:RNA polymerase sigma-70 factor, ECF subfamily
VERSPPRRAAVSNAQLAARNQSLSTVWEALRAELLRFVRKRVRDASLAEDVVHDVLYVAHSRKETLREAGKLRPWLFQIARHAIIDLYRSKRPTEVLPAEFEGEETKQARSAEQELARCLKPLVAHLPPAYRSAVSLAEIEGLTQQEVASRLGLSLSGAKSRVQRARRMLADALQACCRLEFDRRGGIVDYKCQSGCGRC